MSRITIYTDGSCKPTNPGPGGWAYIALLPDCEIWSNGKEKYTTNNAMEITAVIEALKEFKTEKRFLIFSDSTYVINCAQGKWQRKKNLDLWKLYDLYSQDKHIIFQWIKAHNGNRYNELVDLLAKHEI